MIIWCSGCQRRIGGYVTFPETCSYCSAAIPKDTPIEEAPKKLTPYKLSANDRRFLRSLRIDPEPDVPEG